MIVLCGVWTCKWNYKNRCIQDKINIVLCEDNEGYEWQNCESFERSVHNE